MLQTNGRTACRWLGFIALFSLAEYALYHVIVNILTDAPEWLLYVLSFTERAATAVTVAAVACVLLALRLDGGVRRALWGMLLPLGRLPFLVPYFCLDVLNDSGFNSLDALIVGGLFALLEAATLYLLVPAFAAMLGVLSFRYLSHKKPSPALLDPAPLFAYEKPLPLAALIMSLPAFLYDFAAETTLVVDYLRDNAGNYEYGKIGYMVGNYLFAVALLFASEWTILFVCKHLFPARKSANNEKNSLQN